MIDAQARLNLAREALIGTGYFRPSEVGEDVAPRITELWSHMREELERVKVLLEDWTEGDRWQKRATMFLESGNCPVCFGDDECGHRDDCPWGQAESRASALAEKNKRLREITDALWAWFDELPAKPLPQSRLGILRSRYAALSAEEPRPDKCAICGAPITAGVVCQRCNDLHPTSQAAKQTATGASDLLTRTLLHEQEQREAELCPRCQGAGQVHGRECDLCAGSGK